MPAAEGRTSFPGGACADWLRFPSVKNWLPWGNFWPGMPGGGDVLGSLSVLLVLTASPSWAVEIWRNQEKYKFKVELPGGEKFVKSGIDRKFQFDGVTGNLRLIQDDYPNCADRVHEQVPMLRGIALLLRLRPAHAVSG